MCHRFAHELANQLPTIQHSFTMQHYGKGILEELVRLYFLGKRDEAWLCYYVLMMVGDKVLINWWYLLSSNLSYHWWGGGGSTCIRPCSSSSPSANPQRRIPGQIITMHAKMFYWESLQWFMCRAVKSLFFVWMRPFFFVKCSNL